MTPPKTIVIIGAGITGLSAAYFLSQKLNSSHSIIVLEKQAKPGGIIQTTVQDDFLIETGPEAIVKVKPWGIELCKRLKLKKELIEPKRKNHKTFLLKDGTLHDFSGALFSAFKTLGPLVHTKLPLQDESIESFIHRELGESFYHDYLEPLLSGVYGGNPGELSVHSVLAPLFNRKSDKKGNIFVSLRKGLGSLIEKLTASLSHAKIMTNVTVKQIQKKWEGFDLILQGENEPLHADLLLLATPAPISSILVKNFDAALASGLSRISYASSAIFTLGFDRQQIQHPLNGYGFVVHSQEKSDMTACTWSSSKWDGRAPNDKALLRAYVPHVSDNLEKTWSNVLTHLYTLLGIQGKPLLSLVHLQPKSIPRYLVGHQEMVSSIEQLAADHSRLFLAGAAFHGVGIPDCIESAHAAAERMLNQIEKLPAIS